MQLDLDILSNKREFVAKLYMGDCLELMRKIPHGSVDLVLCDPPYGTTACKWDSIVPFEPMWAELKRVARPSAAICIFGQNPFTANLIMSNPKMFKYDWVWKKSCAKNFMNAKKQPLRDSEYISVFYNGQSSYYPQGLKDAAVNNSRPNHNVPRHMVYSPHVDGPRDTAIKTGYPRNIISFANPNQGSVHPTQKPIELLEYLVCTYTREGETVLDFTMGSGSTGVACKNTGRNFVGIEKDKNYFEIAKTRIESA